jgi:hypothetical protein
MATDLIAECGRLHDEAGVDWPTVITAIETASTALAVKHLGKDEAIRFLEERLRHLAGGSHRH